MAIVLPIFLWLVYYCGGGDFSRDIVLGLFVLLTPVVVAIGLCMDGAIMKQRKKHAEEKGIEES